MISVFDPWKLKSKISWFNYKVLFFIGNWSACTNPFTDRIVYIRHVSYNWQFWMFCEGWKFKWKFPYWWQGFRFIWFKNGRWSDWFKDIDSFWWIQSTIQTTKWTANVLLLYKHIIGVSFTKFNSNRWSKSRKYLWDSYFSSTRKRKFIWRILELHRTRFSSFSGSYNFRYGWLWINLLRTSSHEKVKSEHNYILKAWFTKQFERIESLEKTELRRCFLLYQNYTDEQEKYENTALFNIHGYEWR